MPASHSSNSRICRAGLGLEITLCAALCSVPLALTLLGRSGDGGQLELRAPAPFPVAPASLAQLSAWPLQFESFLNDRFAGRPELIGLHSAARLVLGDSGNERVVVGKDGWFFLASENDALDAYRGIKRFSPRQLKAVSGEFNRRKEWMEAQGIRSLFVIVPNKHTIYGEYLPGRFTRAGPTPADELVRALSTRGFSPLLDLRPVLRNAKSSGQLYRKIDTHWNDRGAFIGYGAIIDAMRRESPGIHRVSPDAVAFDTVTETGDLTRLLGLQNRVRETIPRGRVVPSALLEKTGEDWRTTGIRTTSRHAAAPKVVVFCDSFVARTALKYFQESFSEALFVSYRTWDLDREILAREQPDWVVYAIVERFLPVSP